MKSEAFARNLRKIISEQGMSQGQAAKKMNITPEMLSKYISGLSIPRTGNAKKVADGLGVPLGELFKEVPTDDIVHALNGIKQELREIRQELKGIKERV